MLRFKTWRRTLTGVEQMQRSWLDLGVSLQIFPIRMPTDDAHLMDVVAMLKHQTDPVMPKVMEMQILYGQCITGIVKNLGDLLAPDGEYQFTLPILPKDYLK